MTTPMDWPHLRDEIRAQGERFAALLDGAPGGDTSLPHLDWNVGKLGAHVVEVADRYVAFGREEHLAFPGVEDERALMADYNEAGIDQVETRDPAALAVALREANERVLDALGEDGERPLRFYDFDGTVRQAAGVWLGELLIHGWDLGRALGTPWPIPPEDAPTVFEGLLPMLPAYFRPSMAERGRGRYHLRLRGGHGDYGYVVEDGTIRGVVGAPERPDVHIAVDPATFLLLGYRRVGQWSAIARGKVMAWGRKPWLANRMSQLFVPA